ncbi:MAG: sensor histidine kinase, partial [Terriglobales bacterium]
RAPLRQIHGFTRVVVEKYGPQFDAQAQSYLGRIEEGAAQMGRLIDDLLNLARLGRRPLNREDTPLTALVEEVRQELAPESDGREVEWRVQPLAAAHCDRGLVKRIFANLMSNSLKYTRPCPRAVIEVGQKADNGEPVIYVRDNGVGFSMKYADKLFGVFQRLHRSDEFEGTGVGLATVQRIVRKHGGRIWADAEVGRGATFSFTLGAQGTQADETAVEEEVR